MSSSRRWRDSSSSARRWFGRTRRRGLAQQQIDQTPVDGLDGIREAQPGDARTAQLVERVDRAAVREERAGAISAGQQQAGELALPTELRLRRRGPLRRRRGAPRQRDGISALPRELVEPRELPTRVGSGAIGADPLGQLERGAIAGRGSLESGRALGAARERGEVLPGARRMDPQLRPGVALGQRVGEARGALERRDRLRRTLLLEPGARGLGGGLRRDARGSGLERAGLAALERCGRGLAARRAQLRVGGEELGAQRAVAG